MHEFKIGDWVYADDWCYGQITEIYEGTAYVEYNTDRGGGTCGFELSELQPAEPPKKIKFIAMPNYAVIVTFTYDPQVSVLLFNTWDEAMAFIKKDILEEYKIDTKENELDSEYEIYEADGRAVLTTCYRDGTEQTIWQIGTVYDQNEEE